MIISGFAGGGGGGGAGVTGGTGGTGINGGSFGQGGAGGQTAGASGANGGSPSPGGIGGGGGGGGAHGAVLSTSGGLASSTGGNGGNGGSANIGTGGGGGAGGYGAVVNGSSLTLTSGGTVAGGNGGNGGQSFNSSPLAGGGGGTGGIGLDFTGTANSIVNTGTISGGKGGAGGAGNISGANGAGGAGVVGSDLTVTNSGTITGGLSGDGVTRANAITFTGGTNTLELRPGSSITGNVVAFSAADTLALGGSGSATFDVSTIGSSAQYQGFGTFQKTGSSTWTLTGTTSAVTSWAINAGTLAVSSDSNLGNSSGSLSFSGGTLQFLSGFTTSRTVTLNSGGGTFDTNGNDATLAGTISGTGGLTKIGTGTLTLTGANTYGGGTTVTGGLINFNSASNFGSGLITLNGGGLQWATGTTTDISSQLAAFGSGGATFDTNGNNVTLASNLAGTGGLSKIGAGMLTLSGPSTYTGATFVNVGTLQAGVVNAFSPNSSYNVASGATLALAGFNQTLGSLAGAGAVTLGSATLTTGNDNTSTTFSGGITGAGGLTKIGTGALTLSGPSTYSGTTAVNAGTLIVNGSIANSAVTVNSGATLSGTGAVGGLTINSGATFAPGNSPGTMTVAGNLAFQSGALYLVQINSTTASSTNASGSAALAGTVQAAFASGSYATRMYTILSAAGGLGGTTFNTLTTSNLPAGFTASLSYTATDAILNLTATLGQLSGPSIGPSAPSGPGALACVFSLNQCNVANALNAFFNNGGALPGAFVTIFRLTGANLGNALTLLSGEAATGAQQGAFQLTNQFLGIMLDPFVDGRSGAGGGGAIGFAPAREALPEDIALAYAKLLKEPPKPQTFEQRWSVWSAGYGGSNRTSGDPTVLGSHDLSAATAGGAAGLDYRLAPGTVVGFALAGAGTNWGLAQGLGGGKSDAFQAGLYGTTRWGPTYVAAALAFTNHWMSTDRFAFAGDHLTASFNAQSFGGRVESGYRIATIYGGLTPYAAIQAQNFRTPSYTETDLTNGGFALGFNSRNATDTRSELGGRFDRLLLLNPEAALTLRTRVAWAHDWISDPSLAALFQTLPGASFVVNGATPAKNSALTSAGAELRLANGVVLLAKFDGEFASHSSTYAGTGTVRYTW